MSDTQAAPDENYQIVSMEIENFKCVEYVRIEPGIDSVTTIGGGNRNGKTSTIDAIEALLGGKRALPLEPIRRGARRMRLKGEFTKGTTVDLTVELELSANGSTTLHVLDADEKPVPKPQTFLSSLFSQISFDPLEFARADPPAQDQIIKRALRLDFSDIEAKEVAAAEKRKALNAKVRDLDGQLKAAPRYPEAPKTEDSLTELLATLEARQATVDKARVLAREVELCDQSASSFAARVVAATENVALLERQLQEARDVLSAMTKAAEDVRELAAAKKRASDEFKPDDVDEIRAKLATIEETNRQVRANAARAALEQAHQEAQDSALILTDELDALKQEKQKRIAAANFSIPGLGFDDSGVTYRGFPLAQASHSDRITISAAVGVELNPKLRVLLVRDGEKIGADDMATIRAFARERHFQVFVEKFTETGEGCTVVLDGGRVRAPEGNPRS